MANQFYIIIDSRTGQAACSGIWSEQLGNRMIESFRSRQRRGGRPDISLEDVQSLVLQPLQPLGAAGQRAG